MQVALNNRSLGLSSVPRQDSLANGSDPSSGSATAWVAPIAGARSQQILLEAIHTHDGEWNDYKLGGACLSRLDSPADFTLRPLLDAGLITDWNAFFVRDAFARIDYTLSGVEQETLWALADHQGTAPDVVEYHTATDATVVRNHITYDAFGRITSQTDADYQPRFTFTSRDFDPETGHYYYRARYYDAWMGQFLSEDPIGFEAGDFNYRRYVGNDPVNWVDPYGLQTWNPKHPEMNLEIRDKLFKNADNRVIDRKSLHRSTIHSFADVSGIQRAGWRIEIAKWGQPTDRLIGVREGKISIIDPEGLRKRLEKDGSYHTMVWTYKNGKLVSQTWLAIHDDYRRVLNDARDHLKAVTDARIDYINTTAARMKQAVTELLNWLNSVGGSNDDFKPNPRFDSEVLHEHCTTDEQGRSQRIKSGIHQGMILRNMVALARGNVKAEIFKKIDDVAKRNRQGQRLAAHLLGKTIDKAEILFAKQLAGPQPDHARVIHAARGFRDDLIALRKLPEPPPSKDALLAFLLEELAIDNNFDVEFRLDRSPKKNHKWVCNDRTSSIRLDGYDIAKKLTLMGYTPLQP